MVGSIQQQDGWWAQEHEDDHHDHVLGYCLEAFPHDAGRYLDRTYSIFVFQFVLTDFLWLSCVY